MSLNCKFCGSIAGIGQNLSHRLDCPMMKRPYTDATMNHLYHSGVLSVLEDDENSFHFFSSSNIKSYANAFDEGAKYAKEYLDQKQKKPLGVFTGQHLRNVLQKHKGKDGKVYVHDIYEELNL
jgi:hypothetical protein